MPQPALPEDLLAVFAHIDEPGQLARLLGDLLTPAEIEAIGERWLVVKALAAGLSQRAVRDSLGVSITTVSRGSRQMKYGNDGIGDAFDVLVATGRADPRHTAPPGGSAAAGGDASAAGAAGGGRS